MPRSMGSTSWTEIDYYEFPNHFEPSSSHFNSIPDKYPEKWVVYNSGGHFQPLIEK
jgi:hypothetical protein